MFETKFNPNKAFPLNLNLTMPLNYAKWNALEVVMHQLPQEYGF